jgi:nitroreductase
MMITPDPAALAYLAARRSYPAKLLSAPVPDRAALLPILSAALRVPDHGKLEPWRLIVLERAALLRLGALAAARAPDRGLDAEQTAKTRASYDKAHLAVAVVSSPKPSEKIPAAEQLASAACVCLSLVNAAGAAGWGACWLSGWPVYDRGFVEAGLGLSPHETVAGIVHIGTPTVPPGPDRTRPDPAAVTRWMAE